MNIYVGNLSREVSEAELRGLFEEFGTVAKANVIKDNFTNESRGFGFVEMPDNGEAEAAISELDGKEVKGRTIKVAQAKPRERRGGGGFRPRGGGGYGDRGRGGYGDRGPRGGNRY